MMTMFWSKHVADRRTKCIFVCRLDLLWVFETLNTEQIHVYIQDMIINIAMLKFESDLRKKWLTSNYFWKTEK
jgi:hypothetical protein